MKKPKKCHPDKHPEYIGSPEEDIKTKEDVAAQCDINDILPSNGRHKMQECIHSQSIQEHYEFVSLCEAAGYFP